MNTTQSATWTSMRLSLMSNPLSLILSTAPSISILISPPICRTIWSSDRLLAGYLGIQKPTSSSRFHMSTHLMSTIQSIFGPDKSKHVYVPMTNFIPVNTDNSFVTTARRTTGPKKQRPPSDTHSGCLTNSSPQAYQKINEYTYFTSTVEQQQASEETEQGELKRAKISNL